MEVGFLKTMSAVSIISTIVLVGIVVLMVVVISTSKKKEEEKELQAKKENEQEIYEKKMKEYCQYCGAKVSEGDKKCDQCGARML